jgi:S-adenosylmethionine/arginine decarboxylase-like enzyme
MTGVASPDTAGRTAAPDPGRGLHGFGMELALDLADCDPQVINSPDELCAWATLLCEHIGMTAYGDPIVHHFGEDQLAGWSIIQPITTSDLKVHAVDADNTAFVNVFSCKAFDPEAAAAFTVDFFRARRHTATVLQRRAPQAPPERPNP